MEPNFDAVANQLKKYTPGPIGPGAVDTRQPDNIIQLDREPIENYPVDGPVEIERLTQNFTEPDFDAVANQLQKYTPGPVVEGGGPGVVDTRIPDNLIQLDRQPIEDYPVAGPVEVERMPQSFTEPNFDAVAAEIKSTPESLGPPQHRPRDTAEFLASEESRPTGDFARGLGMGIEGMKVTGHALAGQAKDIFGLDPTKQYMDALAIQQAADKKFGGGIDKVEDIHGLGDFVDWSQFTVGRLAPDLALVASGAEAADVMGKMAAKKAGNLLLKKAALKGGTAGLVGSSGLIESGQNWQESMGRVMAGTQDETHPLMDLGAGMVSGATEAVSPVMRLLPGSLVKKMSGRALTRILKGTVGESGQEVSQSLIGNLNAVLQDPTASMTDRKAISEYLNSAAAGALMGPLGAISGSHDTPGRPRVDNGTTGEVADTRWHKFTKPIDKIMQPVSSRLDKLHNKLTPLLRRNIFDTGMQGMESTKVSDAFYDALDKLPAKERQQWNSFAETRDERGMRSVAREAGILDEYSAYRAELDRLRNAAVDAGKDITSASGYIPMRAKDDKALQRIRDLLGIDTERNVDRAVKQSGIATERQALVEYASDPEMRSEGSDTGEVLSAAREYLRNNPGSKKADMIRKNLMSFRGASNAHIQDTTVDTFNNRLRGGISPLAMNQQEELNELSAKPLLTKQELIRRDQLQKDIQAYHDKIGKRSFVDYLPDLKSQAAVDEVNEIFNAYLDQKGTHGIIDTYKKLELMDTLGSPLNAATQFGDLIYPFYHNEVADTIAGMARSVTGKKMTKTDLGIDSNQIAAEFDKGKLSSWLDRTLKWTGFNAADNFGKSTFINSTIRRLKRTKAAELRKEFKNVIPEETINSTIKEFQNYEPGSELSADAKFILFSELLDYQPVALSEVPQTYLTSGNGRIFYMLKTFAIKQLDIFRREALHGLRTGSMKQRKAAAENLVEMSLWLMAAGLGTDEVKDLIKGKLPDREAGDRWNSVINAMLKTMFLSKYTVDNPNSIGTFMRQLLPPAKLPEAMEKDVKTMGDGQGFKSVKSTPIVGELASNWVGGGPALNWVGYDKKKKFKKPSDAQRKYRILKRKYWSEEHKGTREYKALHRYQGNINKLSHKINVLHDQDPKKNADKIARLKRKRDQIMNKVMRQLKWKASVWR